MSRGRKNKDSVDQTPDVKDTKRSPNQSLQRTPYAEIAKLYNMSETGAQNVVKSAFNKIFSNMIKLHGDVFEILKCMCEYFGMTEAELIRKMDDRNLNIVKQFARKNYETNYYEARERDKLIEEGKDVPNDAW
jgi:hypothetical protein